MAQRFTGQLGAAANDGTGAGLRVGGQNIQDDLAELFARSSGPGPTGPAGPTGPTGATGATGAAGSNASANFSSGVAATLAAGPLNDVSPAGYAGGTTNRVIFTPAAGGTTVNGLDATGVPDGFTVLIVNPSATDPLIFAHLAAGSAAANRFSNADAGSVQIPPLGAARATRVVDHWQFS